MEPCPPMEENDHAAFRPRPSGHARRRLMVTILIVEDNAVTRQIMRISLAGQGYRIIEAEDGRSAISKMVEHSPALVIQDLGLPDIDGLSLAQTLHALPGLE